MDKELVKAISEIPTLVETTKTIIDENEKCIKTFANALETRVEAEIPESETQKVVDAVVEGVKNTRCAAPDVRESSKLIAQGVVKDVKEVVEDAVREAMKDTPITVEHLHEHTTAIGLAKMAEEKTRDWLLLVSCTLVGLLLLVGIGISFYFNSDAYWGKQYVEIVRSKYATEEEKETLWKDVNAISALPRGFNKDPKIVKAQIRQNQDILKERRKQARKKKGVYSTEKPLKR